MRYAIISDIHANLEALEVVLQKIDELEPDKTLCLGDLVGYYADPNECVQMLRDRNIQCIMGNHDVVACGLIEPYYFNPAAARAILWTREQLTESNKKYIADLPNSRVIEPDLRMVHGSVVDRDEYLLFRPEIERSFEMMVNTPDQPRVAFFGHTHRKIYYEMEGDQLYAGKQDQLKLRKDSYYLINPGSVGQPRDSDPRASFASFDTETEEVVFYRLKYDIDKTAGKVRKYPFGEGLAKRLYRGV